MSKIELMKNPILKWACERLLVIPVDRHNMDMNAIRQSLKTLKEGHVLGIFPEGTRYKDGIMQDMESGVALLALRSKCRMLPAYIASKPRLLKKTHVYFGDPFSISDIKGVNKEACDEVMARIGAAYTRLIAEHEAAK